MISLVCIDVDGTLVGRSGSPSPRIWSAAERLRARGVHLALCTGRPGFGKARAWAERLDPDGWHVFQNGSSILHLPDGLSRSSLLAREAVEQLVDRARATGRILELYTDTAYAVESTAERARRHASLLGIPFNARDLRTVHEPVVRAQWLIPHAELEAVLAEPHEGLHLSPSLSPLMPDTTFVNVTPRGVDKAAAVRLVTEAYGISMSSVMMVGDGANDASVMRAVGFPVAMGNAEPEALAAARHVVARVDDDGLLEALALAG